MHHHYDDIRDKIKEEPKWWDEYAVPRYCDFAPNEVAFIYAREVVLLRIGCQNCGKEFKVAFSWAPWVSSAAESLIERAKAGRLHYGDPPNIGCCPVGPTMNSEFIEVLEMWENKTPAYKWKRLQKPSKT